MEVALVRLGANDRSQRASQMMAVLTYMRIFVIYKNCMVYKHCQINYRFHFIVSPISRTLPSVALTFCKC